MHKVLTTAVFVTCIYKKNISKASHALCFNCGKCVQQATGTQKNESDYIKEKEDMKSRIQVNRAFNDDNSKNCN